MRKCLLQYWFYRVLCMGKRFGRDIGIGSNNRLPIGRRRGVLIGKKCHREIFQRAVHQENKFQKTLQQMHSQNIPLTTRTPLKIPNPKLIQTNTIPKPWKTNQKTTKNNPKNHNSNHPLPEKTTQKIQQNNSVTDVSVPRQWPEDTGA